MKGVIFFFFIVKPSEPGLIGLRHGSRSHLGAPAVEESVARVPWCSGHPDATGADTLTATTLGGMEANPSNLIPHKLS